MASEITSNTPQPTMDDLLVKYADRLRKIYEKRTAVDLTFEGLLFHFALDLKTHGFVEEQ